MQMWGLLFRPKLSIAPYWNWNRYYHYSNWKFYYSQSHHIGIEMELCEIKYQANPLSIAPYWNWNTPMVYFLYILVTSQSHHIGIEIYIFYSCNISAMPLNRTILELKCFYNKLIFIVKELSIAPYWNWNTFKRAVVTSKSFSQSHHIGIEIFLVLNLLFQL